MTTDQSIVNKHSTLLIDHDYPCPSAIDHSDWPWLGSTCPLQITPTRTSVGFLQVNLQQESTNDHQPISQLPTQLDHRLLPSLPVATAVPVPWQLLTDHLEGLANLREHRFHGHRGSEAMHRAARLGRKATELGDELHQLLLQVAVNGDPAATLVKGSEFLVHLIWFYLRVYILLY